MQGNARDSLGVTREAVGADERQAGFHGIENSAVEHTVRVIVPSKDVIQPGWRAGGDFGLRFKQAVAFPRTRADPATLIQGGSS